MQIVHFTPPELARLFGVNESTIKRWIDRGLLHATRTPGGHRRVSQRDVQQFLKTQKQARRYSYVLARLHRTPQAETWRQYYELHKNYEPTNARTLVTGSLLACGSVHCVLQDTVIPALTEIGAAWKRGEIDIADEHRMSFLIRSDLVALENMLPVPATNAPTVLLACVPKENHELVLHMLGLIAREAGWHTLTLGINVPAADIERAAAERSVALVALAKVYRGAATTTYVRDVRARVRSRVPLVLGGAGWSARELTTCEDMRGVEYIPTLQAFAATLRTNATRVAPTP